MNVIGKCSLLNLYSWRETTLHDGQSHRMTGIYQSRQVTIASQVVQKVYPLSNWAITPLTLVPIAVGLLASLHIREPNTRDILEFLSSSIGIITHIVAAVALVMLGHYLALAVLAAGHVEPIQAALETYQLPLFVVSAFVGGGLCEQTVALLHLFLMVRPYLVAAYYKWQPQEVPFLDPDPRIDLTHFSKKCEPPPPVDAPKILKFFDELDWSEVPDRVTNDARLRDGESVFEKIAVWWSADSTAREVRFLRRELKALTSSDLPQLARDRLAWIASTRNKEALVDLALEANVCKTGKLGAITDIYFLYVDELSLEERIYKILQEYRYNLFKAVYFERIHTASWSAIRHLIDFQNRHIFHAIMNEYAPLGLPNVGAQDDTVALDEGTKALLVPFFTDLQKAVLGHYTLEVIQEIVRERIPQAEIAKYFGFTRDVQPEDLNELFVKMNIVYTNPSSS